jgi:hypothetical protein
MPLEEQVQYNVASRWPRDVEIEFKSFGSVDILAYLAHLFPRR